MSRQTCPRSSPIVSQPLRIAAVTLLAYLLLATLVLNYYHGDLRGFSVIGPRFITQSDCSRVIRPDPPLDLRGTGLGYDGQFAYYIALDPLKARYCVDNPPYRYTRILYPLLAWLGALGQPAAIPLTLVLVNLVAAVGGTAALAAWCQAHRQSPWWALVYGLNMGQLMAFTRNLTEVLACALVAGAIYSFDCRPRQRWLAASLFGLAGLARETTLLFAVLYSLRLLIDAWPARPRELGARAMFGALAVGPALLWQVGLYCWLGSSGLTAGPGFAVLPLAGLIPLYPFAGSVLLVLLALLPPAFLCLGAALRRLWIDPAARQRTEIWVLLLHIVFFVLLLPSPSLVDLYSAARLGLGGVLAAVCAVAYFPWRGWFYGAAAVWMLAALSYCALLAGLTPRPIWP
ncbi:MAG TPA: hypothetical protein VKY74_28390 [Chloroflexia bacterium]|nr:hypothetical protein [Chloroflexia bacterium]